MYRSCYLRKSFLGAALALLVPWIPGCTTRTVDTGAGGAAGSSAAGEPRLSPRTTVVEGAALEQVTLAPDRLVFAPGTIDLSGRAPGDILLGNRASGAGAPNRTGFLRKIKAISTAPEGTVVETEDASLPEAIEEGSFSGTFGEIAEPSAEQLAPGVSPQNTGKFGKTIPLANLDGTSLLDESFSVDISGKPVGVKATAKLARGNLSYTLGKSDLPGWDVLLGIKNGNPLAFKIINRAQIAADISLEAGITLDSQLSGDDLAQFIAKQVSRKAEKTLVKYDLPLGTIPAGLFKIPVNVEVEVAVSCTFVWGGDVKVTVGAKPSIGFVAGAEISAGKLQPVFEVPAPALGLLDPVYELDASTRSRCDVQPTLRLKFFDQVGAHLWVRPYAETIAGVSCVSNAKGKLSFEAQAGVEGGVGVFSKALGPFPGFDKSCLLFDVQQKSGPKTKDFDLPGANPSCIQVDPPKLFGPKDAKPASCWGDDLGGLGGAGGAGGSGQGGAGQGGAGQGGAGQGGAGQGGEGGAGQGGEGGGGGQECKPGYVPFSGTEFSQEWTCSAALWADCKCDKFCSCGGIGVVTDPDCVAPGDLDCGGAGGAGGESGAGGAGGECQPGYQAFPGIEYSESWTCAGSMWADCKCDDVCSCTNTGTVTDPDCFLFNSNPTCP